jgi:pimeloyl-ACP methyl ester carboxylesterase
MTTKTFDKIYWNAPREQKEQLVCFRKNHPHKHLTVSGLEWDYIVGGKGPEALVVCVGGTRTSDPAFRLIMALEGEYRIIAPTYPDANRMDQLVEGINAILEVEEIRQAHIWGTSLGGMVVQCFLRRYPERVKSMIAGDTFVPNQALADHERKEANLLRFIPLRPLIPWVRSRMNKVITTEITEENERAFWQAFINEWLTTEYNQEWIINSREIIIDYGRNYSFQPTDLAAWAGEILIIDSDTDRTVGEKNLAELKVMYPQAQIYTFHNAGHVPVITREKEYISLIRGFLEQQREVLPFSSSYPPV